MNYNIIKKNLFKNYYLKKNKINQNLFINIFNSFKSLKTKKNFIKIKYSHYNKYLKVSY